ncbi:hypothetical protein O181_096897 [Austropuccinia psidii MF-1]|uniref:Integrase catalytic domain-containing protein n=1 Tax=Austropuccinia psidii MF-1 TaxID=1389203 RepID=A0A9Q3PDY7_9BASI|nr:hypothetical protein [Austropuccinia psidii MF-1]
MVFSSSEEEHVKQVASVLQRLRDNNLFAKASKCVFHASSVEYLGYFVSSDGLKMDSSNIQQILNWPQPKNINALQSFLGFANFYRHFIKHYSKKSHLSLPFSRKILPLSSVRKLLVSFNYSKKLSPILANSNPSLPTIVETEASDYALGAVLSQEDGIKESRFFSIKVEIFSDLVEKIQKEVWQEKDYKEILKQLARGESVPDYSLEPQAKLLLSKEQVVIPRNEELQLNILQKRHDSPLVSHPGQEKTLKLIKRDFHWAGMNQLIKYYVSSCQQCSRNKNIHHKKFGLLKPLQIPSGPWNSLSIDFITQFHLSNNFDSILVAVDRFSKKAIFIPDYGTITALDLAQIFIGHVFSKNGLSVSIVSDIGSLFVSSFWTQLCQQLKISRDLSTSFHPETDGQTEMVNQILEQYLWMYVSYHQDDCYTWLPLAEFSYDNAEHSSTKQSSFFTIYGRNHSFDLIHISQDSPAGKLSTKLQSLQQVVKEELESVIRRFKKYADRN